MMDRYFSRHMALGTRLLPVLLLTSLTAGCSDADPGASDDESKSPSASTSETTTPSPTDHESIVATISTGNGPITLTATDKAVWVELHRDNLVARIDPQTNEQAEVLDVPVHCEIEAAKGSVWATIHADSLVTRFDARNGHVLQQAKVPGPCGVGVDGRSVWITSPDTGTLYRLVEGRGKPVEKYQVGEAPFGVLPAPDALWITSEAQGGVLRRVDRETQKVTTVGKFLMIDSAVLAFGSLWLSARDGGSVWKLDPATGRVLDQTKLSLPTGMVQHGNRLWITLQGGVLTSIDPQTLEVISDADLGHGELGPPIFAFGSLWTSSLEENLVLRGGRPADPVAELRGRTSAGPHPAGRLAARRRTTFGAVAQSVRAEDS